MQSKNCYINSHKPPPPPSGNVRHFKTLPICRTSFVDGPYRGRLQRTSGKWGGGGFEISDISGGGWFVKVRTSENF